jgi:mannose-6-phosphate isomerase-like protein (cupin superfamily)
MRYVFDAADVTTYRFPTHRNDLLYGREEAVMTEAFIVILEPGESPPLHKHDDTEQVFYVTEGAGMLQIGADKEAQQFRIGPGAVVRVPPGTWHRVRNDGVVPVRYFSVDAFVGGKPVDEPTWDSHVEVMCDTHGWSFQAVKKSKGG